MVQNAVGRRRSSIQEGGQCSKGQNWECASGLVCGKYSNGKDDYQCCSSYNVNDDGVAWCTNPEGGACSDGNNENCQYPSVCGVACKCTVCENGSRCKPNYQCCTSYTTNSPGDYFNPLVGVAVCDPGDARVPWCGCGKSGGDEAR